MLLRNRHPADALADVRAEIKQLKIREAELRHELLKAHESDRRGVHWRARVRNITLEHLDAKAAIKHFGQEAMNPFMRKNHVPEHCSDPRVTWSYHVT